MILASGLLLLVPRNNFVNSILVERDGDTAENGYRAIFGGKKGIKQVISITQFNEVTLKKGFGEGQQNEYQSYHIWN